MEATYSPTVNRLMCSPVCPCNEAIRTTWEKYTDEDLLAGNRAKNYEKLTAA